MSDRSSRPFAVVTGGSNGIGFELARQLIGNGHDVLIAAQDDGHLADAALRLAGVRSPKWLRRLTVQGQPSDNPIQAGDYKLYPAAKTADTADPAQGHTIDTMPLNAAICEPARGATLTSGDNRVRGYAVSEDRAVVRVDVSGNGGRSWTQAELGHEADATFAWTFWSADLDLPPGEHELAVRAWDEAGQTQPALPDETWNHKGYLCACWHRVRVNVA